MNVQSFSVYTNALSFQPQISSIIERSHLRRPWIFIAVRGKVIRAPSAVFSLSTFISITHGKVSGRMHRSSCGRINFPTCASLWEPRSNLISQKASEKRAYWGWRFRPSSSRQSTRRKYKSFPKGFTWKTEITKTRRYYQYAESVRSGETPWRSRVWARHLIKLIKLVAGLPLNVYNFGARSVRSAVADKASKVSRDISYGWKVVRSFDVIENVVWI